MEDEKVFDIVPIVAKALEPIKKAGTVVQSGWYDENIKKTHITFLELSDNPEDFSDDEESSVDHLIQVDVWSFNDLESNRLKEKAKSLLLSNGFYYQDGENLQENKDNKDFYHKALRVIYSEDKEGND